jgi:heat-inducible transcriptional repressor
LARASHNAALATAPRAPQSRFKHLELVGIRDAKVLLVLVLQQGLVKQQLLDLDEPIAQSELSQISNELNDKLPGADADQVAAYGTGLDPDEGGETPGAQALLVRQVTMLVAEIMERIDGRLGGPIYRDGLAQVLERPEFTSSDNVRKIVSVFEQRPLLEQLMGEFSDGDDIQVVISGDGRYRELEDVSLIIGSYGVDDLATGVLGVVGPLRMSYGRTISAVRFVSHLMSEMVEDMYGE